MNRIFISGLINLETTLQVDSFPVDYQPVRYPFFGVNSMISGVGFNVACALTRLGDETRFASLLGQDAAGRLALATLGEAGIGSGGVLGILAATPQSVILFEPSGRRAIHVDLKDIQERTFPLEIARPMLADCKLAVLCNINFSRPLLSVAREMGLVVATDVHAIASLDDDYNRDFMVAAQILFMSHEKLPEAPEDWARRTLERYNNEIVVIGLGAEGALLAVRHDGFVGRFPAIYTRPVINSIGAGDALFSSFMHCYLKNRDPYTALKKAMIYASYKIGANGAANGLMSELELETWIRERSVA